MADQASVKPRPKDQGPGRRAAGSIASIARDVIALVELQGKLAIVDGKRMARGLILPLVLLFAIALLMLGAIATSFVAIGYVLVDHAGFTRSAAFGLSALAGIVTALILGGIVALRVRKSLRAFDRSRQEFDKNVESLKSLVAKHEAAADD